MKEGKKMEYRKLPKETAQVSIIGFGGSGLHESP